MLARALMEERTKKKKRRATNASDLHGNADTSLNRSANVVAVPGGDLGDVREDAQQHKEAGKIFDARDLHGNENNKAYDTITRLARFFRCLVLFLAAGRKQTKPGDHRVWVQTYAMAAIPIT